MSVTRRLTQIEHEQESRLRNVISETAVRRAELNALRQRDMDMKTYIADLEFQRVVLEDKYHKLQRSLCEKQREVDELQTGGEDAIRELVLEYDFQVKQMKINGDNHQHQMQHDIQTQIEHILQEKVGRFQQERTQAQEALLEVETELRELDTKYRSEVLKLNEEQGERLEGTKQHVGAKRALIETEIREVGAEMEKIRAEIAAEEKMLEEQQQVNRSVGVSLMEAIQKDREQSQETQALAEELRLQELALSEKRQKIETMLEYVAHTQMDTARIHERLTAEETNRRRLHNRLQELKGNIRVFCRARPLLSQDTSEVSDMAFPDDFDDCNQEIILRDAPQSVLGATAAARELSFRFDQVFDPLTTNAEIFEEISQLVQSALDGYNVCVFAYGQTGSGKTYTMSARGDGMIPRATQQLFASSDVLRAKGWEYAFRGLFLEIYNEAIHDLLIQTDKAKYEIRHDQGKTEVTGLSSVALTSATMVNEIFERANKNRSVAATKANERSSRSHSVFVITIHGSNSKTGERCEGTLNLIDLAGSERLNQSQATGDRLKETQAINKSLSCLGDVIAALGSRAENPNRHIPYRNSKLTYLLQNSLGGESKTLMFVNISPAKAHFNETINSLRFATKVNSTRLARKKG
ncbi:hypothetical protein BABINDRAFT_171469 [Babjeviella inositovora NRRL Y-12698]|uniref:Kinesin-like protein n=1 Tax=Babjeviella inositovora NRRL Y-12698 TaxID=984486 RepID=A0A1E3QQE0_9ASCO|nr:uncharacterized protein BABINDRAFT_171469 [Babjeviella inositovora NRRL Y-12698]ODQ79891.1 hypothetical protein BABINDRAFT_171469 [Babjeviella inositovora NRRL Y-12698]